MAVLRLAKCYTHMSVYIAATDTLYKIMGDDIMVIEDYKLIQLMEEDESNKYY